MGKTNSGHHQQQPQQEEQAKIGEEWFNIGVPLRISNTIDDKLYVEYMMDSFSKTNKLAVLGDARSINFNPEQLESSRNYAEVGNNYSANPDLPPKLSNEKVKAELTREYFQDPEFYTTKVVESIIGNLEAEYSFTEKELEILRDMAKGKERLQMIKFAEEKLQNGDRALVDGIKAINQLMENLETVKKIKEGTSSDILKKDIRKYLVSNCFNDDYDWKSLDEIRRDKIVDFAMKEDTVSVANQLKEINYSPDTDIIQEKAKDIVKHTKIAREAHEEIVDKMNIASRINGDIKLKEQFLMLNDFVNRAEKAISSGKIEDIRDFKQHLRTMVGSGKSGSFTGILAEIDKAENLDLQKTLKKKNKIDIKKYKKLLNYGIQKHIFGSILEDLRASGIDEETSQKIVENYKDLAINLRKARERALEKGQPFGVYEKDAILKEFEHKNMMDILSSTNSELAKELIDKNANKFALAQDVDVNIMEQAVEVMNTHNILNNNNIDVQPDEVESVVSQSIRDEGLANSAVRAIKNRDKANDASKKNKGDYENRLSEIFGANNYLRLKSVSQDLNGGINRFLVSRETLSKFKSCLSNAVVAKTSMETLASTTTQCGDKLLSDLQSDIQRVSGQIQQAGQGLASVIPLALLLSVKEESLRHIERNFVKEQNKIGEQIAKIVQDLNSASSEMDKEARLELIANESQGGLSFSTVHESESNSYKSSLNKERMAETLARATEEKRKRTAEEVLQDKKYNFKNIEISGEGTKSNDVGKKLTGAEMASMVDMYAKEKTDDIGAEQQLSGKEENQSEIAKVVDENEKEIAARTTLNSVAVEKYKENGNPLYFSKNSDTSKDNNTGLEQEKSFSNGNSNIRVNRANIENALWQLHELQKEKTRVFLGSKDRDYDRDAYKEEIAKIEEDKKVLQEQLILESLIEMEANSKEDNRYQPREKIRDAIRKFKQATQRDGEKIYDLDGSELETVKFSHSDKKTIVSEALNMIDKNNPSMHNTFMTLRDTNSTSVVERNTANGINTVQLATDEKAYILEIYKENEKYLKDKTNNFEEEKTVAYNAMREATKGTSLEQKVNTLDDYINMFDNIAEKAQGVGQAETKTKKIQQNEFISHHVNRMNL